MSFTSVRSIDGRTYTFEEAVLCGWADDGGMLLPTVVPSVDRATLRRWASLTYPALCAEVLKLYVPKTERNITHDDIDAIVDRCFERFEDKNVVTMRSLPPACPAAVAAAVRSGHASASAPARAYLPRKNSSSPRIHVAELWHGPTLAFKDLGMSVLGAMLGHFLSRTRSRTTLLVGTSGDTGSSAIEAVRMHPRSIQIVVLYPVGGRCTVVQERQMTHVAVREDVSNVHLIGVEGSSDDLDVPMEACFADSAFKARHKLGSINSVNIVRLLVQTVHFFYTYLRVCPDATREMSFVVPSGAAGHVCAGALALRMGLPASQLVAATNSNDALHRLLDGGTFFPAPASTTVSPSMDIQVPYNMYRLFALASGAGDFRCPVRHASDGMTVGERTRALQSTLNAQQHAGGEGEPVLALPPALLSRLRGAAGTGLRLRSTAVSDRATLATIRAVHAATQTEKTAVHVLDPHTAVGVAAACLLHVGCDGVSPHGGASDIICMGCAHPAKFVSAVSDALGMSESRVRELLRAQATAPARDASLVRTGEEVHPQHCVLNVLDLGSMDTGLESGVAPPQTLPYGCCEVLRADSKADWETQTRRVIERAWTAEQSKL